MASAPAPSRCVLSDVPQARFYRSGDVRCPEDFPFEGCVRAILEYLGAGFGCDKVATSVREGRDFGCTYSYVLAATGSGFHFGWSEDAWQRAQFEPVTPFADELEPVRRAFWAVGRDVEFVPAGSPEAIRARIVESIHERGRPALARGIVGPPEWCIVTGYDGDGDTLVGWSYFQDELAFNAGVESEPSGYFRKTGWEDSAHGLALIGDETTVPTPRSMLRQTLEWGIDLLLTSHANGNPAGAAAFGAWVNAIKRDDDWPAGDPARLLARYDFHHGWVGGLAESRWYCGEFLQRMAKWVPETADDLLAARRCFVAEHDLMWDVWRVAGGIGVSPEHAARFAPAEARAQAAELVLRSRDLDVEAAGHLEWALEGLGQT